MTAVSLLTSKSLKQDWAAAKECSKRGNTLTRAFPGGNSFFGFSSNPEELCTKRIIYFNVTSVSSNQEARRQTLFWNLQGLREL